MSERTGVVKMVISCLFVYSLVMGVGILWLLNRVPISGEVGAALFGNIIGSVTTAIGGIALLLTSTRSQSGGEPPSGSPSDPINTVTPGSPKGTPVDPVSVETTDK